MLPMKDAGGYTFAQGTIQIRAVWIGSSGGCKGWYLGIVVVYLLASRVLTATHATFRVAPKSSLPNIRTGASEREG